MYFNLKLNWDQDPNHRTLQAIEHSATACLLLVSNHVVCPSTFGHFFSENFKRPIPALKISDIMIHKDLLRPSTTQHPKDSQSTAENHAANVHPSHTTHKCWSQTWASVVKHCHGPSVDPFCVSCCDFICLGCRWRPCCKGNQPSSEQGQRPKG